MKKSLVSCFVSAVVLVSSPCLAVDMLQTEDESLLWQDEMEVAPQESVRDVLFNATGGVEELYYIPSAEPIEPFKGEGLKAISLPDANPQPVVENAVDEDTNPHLLRVKNKTPRSFFYPIGRERKEMEAPRREWYDPNLMKRKDNSPKNLAHKALLNEYRQVINDCYDLQEDKIDLEMDMLGGTEVYTNAAYLSQSLEDLEQCYDDVGLDIIRRFYNDDEAKMNEYREETQKFHVVSDDVSFDAKFCGDNCGVRAVAEAQLQKFADYRAYLAELLIKAPIIEDVPEQIAPVAQPVLTKKTYQAEVPMVDDDDIPFIDEADL